jgi:hypothetical protein
VLIVVVPHGEAHAYRQQFDTMLILELPDTKDRVVGVGFARWAIQMLASFGYIICSDTRREKSIALLGFWSLDDLVSKFYKLKALSMPDWARVNRHNYGSAKVNAARTGEDGMHLQAFLTFQADPISKTTHLGSFLRDNGAATTANKQHSLDDVRLYKVHYHNVSLLRELGAHWEPDAVKFEDILFATQILRLGGHTTKLLSFCYRASNMKAGGCATARGQIAPRLGGIMSEEAFLELPPRRQQLVHELAEVVNRRKLRSVGIKRAREQAFPSITSSSESSGDSASS